MGVTPARARELIDRFSDRRVLVLGDVMLDHYIWGEASRISPEAPVPVVGVSRESSRLGGAANVAHNVRTLGGRPSLLAVIGDDPAGELLRAELTARDIAPDQLVIDPQRPTIKKTRIIARSQQIVRIDRERAGDVDGSVFDQLSQRIADALAQCEAIVISDYGKGVISGPLLARWLPAFVSSGLPVCVDPKETHFHSYRGVTVLTPNVSEASFAAGRRIRDEATLEAVGRELVARLEAQALLITRGEAGMSLFPRTGARIDIPAVGRDVYDVTGAGDTVVATLALGLAAGGTLAEATWLANHAAGRAIRELGTAAVTRQEIWTSLNHEPHS